MQPGFDFDGWSAQLSNGGCAPLHEYEGEIAMRRILRHGLLLPAGQAL